MTACPRLRDDLVLVEQSYRGEQTYILKDPVSHKYFRFKPLEIMVMQTFDGERTVAEAAEALAEEGLPVSASVLGPFVESLSRMGLLVRSLGERSVLQLERLRAERRQRRRAPLFKGELLRMRWSLANPDRMFDRWMPRLGFFFSRAFIALSIVLFAIYVLIIALKWPEFRDEFLSLYRPGDYTLGKIAVFWGTGLFIVAVHELGHGVTCKHFGGRVHEMGAMLIYFQPAFYCNVNDAWTFPDRSARLWVTAAGSWIQLVLAAFGAILWWMADPGTLVSRIGVAAVLVGGATTVLANANPLIPLDGYYALSDWLEIPNLRQRALAHIAWLFKRRVLRLDVQMPPSDEREQRVFLVYGLLAFAYITFALALVGAIVFGWASGAFGIAGAMVFIAVVLLMARPQLREWSRIFRSAAREAQVRWRGSRAPKRLLAGLAIVVLVLAVIPWPVTLAAPFVAAAPMVTRLSAPDSGVISLVNAREGMRVSAGAPLLMVRNLDLEREAIAASRASDSLGRLVAAARARGDAAASAELEHEAAGAEAVATGLTQRVRALTLRAASAGVVMTSRPEEMAGRPVAAGEVLLSMADTGIAEARVALTGAGATLVRPGAAVRLLLHDGRSADGIVTSVAAATTDAGGEARVRVEGERWRPGLAGRARITLRRSSVGGALWWRVRSLVRSDLLL
jgi:putative peptide zinc metalloprotease protein